MTVIISPEQLDSVSFLQKSWQSVYHQMATQQKQQFQNAHHSCRQLRQAPTANEIKLKCTWTY